MCKRKTKDGTKDKTFVDCKKTDGSTSSYYKPSEDAEVEEE